ncbi:phosphoribosylaminoimidazolesuccinocarboxamide synthase [Acidipropionibacterium acidipropionici]|uniref:phosphoribosylaminoimidazolesuccinocarboxamide synthase n=1 Tax=Acidipropionibacterium acidipropionici TaxID=1748 RepID=UPI00110A220C|nr:phosphoribosylaminoimidazolesuccinocarboxamide synthase [Acidipropionibacterium acidipropionici]QCV94280.1 phosphoribosylaminoimidazolesuccinocarboxamide synthase [Acidipropionibacterium acidipropionici]
MTSADDLGLPLLSEGKVRRLYRLPDQPGRLLMVATDRISAYDHILSPDIPDKGKVLTGISLWWFGQLSDVVENHLVSTDVPEAVAGRAMVVEALEMFPVECVVRGYLTGSGWAEYQKTQSVCGIELPGGLKDGSRLPEPIFTPATKAQYGEHDENIDFDTLVGIVGADVAAELRRLSLAIYAKAEQIARDRGIILADTKVEFGRRADGTIVLGDEVLTPDSSRFWDARDWHPGGKNPSFDKQFVRDWLTFGSGWDSRSGEKPPALPGSVVAATRKRYLEAWSMLTGIADPLAGTNAEEQPPVEETAEQQSVEATEAPADAAGDVAAEADVAEAAAAPADVAPETAQVSTRPEPTIDPAGGPEPAAELESAAEPEPTSTIEESTETGDGPDKIDAMARVVVEVMPKPEILDPQGKAITGALGRLGHDGLTVRQGKRFEITGEGVAERLDEIRAIAEEMLANTVIESFDVRVEG